MSQPKPNPTPVSSAPSAASPTPTSPAAVAVAATTPALSESRQKKRDANAEEFIILIRSPRGTLHAVMDTKKGPGAIAVFHSGEAAANVLTSTPACLNNPSVIIPVEGL